MDELCRIEAHDAEVLCLEYSQHVQPIAAPTANGGGRRGSVQQATRKR
jgi:hypothetical protein